MNRKLLFLFLLTCLCRLNPPAAYGQSVSISGKLSLAESGKAVSGADVFIQGTSIRTVSNRQGWYEFTALPEGNYAIAIFALGYKSQVKEISAAAGDKMEVNFELTELEEILDELTFLEQQARGSGIGRLRSVEGTAIYEAKKSEVIVLNDITANKATNNSRQIYSKVPGLNIWESDGAGIQLGIGGRGLSPNRTSNFNTRQNGYDISADALGYPESYYTPPAEAIEKIQIVRGAASLQYGTQFGGMINFVMKKGPSDTPLELTTRQTIGSFGLFSSYNSIGGSVGKMDYYTFYQRKQGNGWRPNSGFEVNTFFTDFNFQLTEKFFLCFEYTHMNYLAQQPGGLTDEHFRVNPRQSLRERNWFKVNWNLGAVLMEYKFSNRTRLEMKNFGLLAGRDALGDLDPILNSRAAPTEERELIQDTFRNFGNETRVLHHYKIKEQSAVFLAGIRYYQGETHKLQGDANNGTAPAFEFLNPDSLYSDHIFPNRNLAFFTENIFSVNEKFSITPGFRFDWIDTRTKGYYQQEGYYQTDENDDLVNATKTLLDSRESKRPVFLTGLGLSYKPGNKAEVYANFSQNYRSITFSDLRVRNENAVVDPNLKDESGYNTDLGIRGQIPWLNYDLSLFYLDYNDKIGSVYDQNIRITKNISDAYIFGAESFFEGDIIRLLKLKKEYSFMLFTNVAVIEGKYNNSEESIFEGKKVELVPAFNIKSGLTFRQNDFAASFQYSYVSDQFTDATNEKSRKVSGSIIGPVPSYYVMDLSLQYQLKSFLFEGGINNLANNYYFTRRAEGYPGPGIIPSDGRSFYLTLGYKFRK